MSVGVAWNIAMGGGHNGVSQPRWISFLCGELFWNGVQSWCAQVGALQFTFG